ncbi:hypothetical protein N7510_001488 [Penicillium lagena]|uniref:uncharacterized protein n=1 Tax=Penicillium lagena TaxID=94218 RepID=UPI002540E0B5|nr:uncharacterized protein N7510_001488 [Penicillium lagena]KAJ5625179.1 hypothetical protein N7510_001488 [Penicillium lagena]
MGRLLDLPDELLSTIIDHIQDDTTGTITTTLETLPFHQWGELYERAVGQKPSQRIKNLHSLLITSRRFNRLLKPIFHRDICVHDRFGDDRLDQLHRTLEKDPGIEEHILSAIVPCNYIFTLNVYRFFWFPNIETLSIVKFKDWEPLEFENDSHVCTSPVKALNLISCGAHEKALAAVLSWPAGLEVLHYDADQGEWEGHLEDEPVNSWTCAAFVRTLQPQQATLRELTLTRPPLEHEGLFNGPRIDLSEFTALTTLRIYHVFLCGWDDPRSAWRALPRSLEALEVFYDDTELTQFLEEGESEAYDPFFLALVRHKKTHLPHLLTVSINSPEGIWDDERDGFKPGGPWMPPPSLAHEFETAGVKLDVWIGPMAGPQWERTDISLVFERPRKRCRLL